MFLGGVHATAGAVDVSRLAATRILVDRVCLLRCRGGLGRRL